MRHLTDEEIQAYLDGLTENLDASLISHLDTCRECRKAIDQYRLLYTCLSDDSSFGVTTGLTPSVMKRLGLKRSQRRSLPVEIVLAAAGVMASACVALTWFDPGSVARTIAAAFRSFAGPIAALIEATGDYLIALNHGITTLAVGLTVLLLMAALDAFISHKPLPSSRRPPRR